jgi:hypothetical protein
MIHCVIKSCLKNNFEEIGFLGQLSKANNKKDQTVYIIRKQDNDHNSAQNENESQELAQEVSIANEGLKEETSEPAVASILIDHQTQVCVA